MGRGSWVRTWDSREKAQKAQNWVKNRRKQRERRPGLEFSERPLPIGSIGWGEGNGGEAMTSGTPPHEPPGKTASSPQPSPPSDGGEGENQSLMQPWSLALTQFC